MGGGATMKAAAKVAGIGVITGGTRPVPAQVESHVAAAACHAMPVVSLVSSSSNDKAGNGMQTAVQRPSWEIDDWEFAGGEEELVIATDREQSFPRVVFGGVPTMSEAIEATSELKDALEKGLFSEEEKSALPLTLDSGFTEIKACVSKEAVPKHALQAFKLLSEDSRAQTVVASIACDPNVWDVVFRNEALVEYLESSKTVLSPPYVDLKPRECSVIDESNDQFSPRCSEDLSDDAGICENARTSFIDRLKTLVGGMVTNVSTFFQDIFGGSGTQDKSVGANEKAFMDNRILGVSIVGLVIMVIMVVVLRRPLV